MLNYPKNKYLWFFIIFCMAVIIAQIVYYLLVVSVYGNKAMGPFGDSFGAFNAFVSALAFGGLVAAIYLQRDELALQRKELAQTREVLAAQMKQLEAQNTTLLKQRFESTFFNLLNHLSNTIDDIPQITEYGISSDQARREGGRKSFFVLYDSLKRLKEQRNYSSRDLFDEFKRTSGYNFLSFFEVFLQVILYLENSPPNHANQLHYNLVKSLLSEPAKIILFYRIAYYYPGVHQGIFVREGFFADMNKDLLFDKDDIDLYNWELYHDSQ